MAEKRKVCHAHFPHVRDLHKRAVELGTKPSKIKYSDRAKGFCFRYISGAPLNIPAGRRGGH